MSHAIEGLVGQTAGPLEFSWTERDTRLYALAVGAASADPEEEPGLGAVVPDHPDSTSLVPSFATLPGSAARRSLDLRALGGSPLVHAEHGIEIVQPLHREGRVSTHCTVVNVWDKGSGALIETESVSADVETGRTLIVNRSSSFVKGLGGFGGERGPRAEPMSEDRSQVVASYPTRPDQALMYALLGDDNPLHWDARVARAAGFERPILHGLCTYGIAARAVVEHFGGGDPVMLRSLTARFTAPVYPGDTLTISMSRDGESVRFRVSDPRGATVLDRGSAVLGEADS
jgi:acyl dehydratase